MVEAIPVASEMSQTVGHVAAALMAAIVSGTALCTLGTPAGTAAVKFPFQLTRPEQKVEGEFVGLLATLLTAVGHFMPTVRHFMQQYAVAADQTISVNDFMRSMVVTVNEFLPAPSEKAQHRLTLYTQERDRDQNFPFSFFNSKTTRKHTILSSRDEQSILEDVLKVTL
ncbi:MAG: hypothetical protein CYPHOPRED_000754 [Cyphobasidiales sp. Tagirdzhanova-0007]|nr:MAG: hypothetical protein CYPHOPRED_000754 [Cyphobasidiales sp. Tagirdzhanova-0007]